jgi:hypothetical protein
MDTLADLDSGDGGRLRDAMKALLVEHPLVNDDGTPMAVGDIPAETAAEIAGAMAKALREESVPNG